MQHRTIAKGQCLFTLFLLASKFDLKIKLFQNEFIFWIMSVKYFQKLKAELQHTEPFLQLEFIIPMAGCTRKRPWT